MKFLAIVMLLFCTASGNIISKAGGGNRTVVETRDYYRTITAYQEKTSFPVTLHCKFFRYSEPKVRMPLVVFFISWGSTIDKTEDVVQYENMMNDPFVSLVIMPEKNGQDFNTTNWYWGTVYNSKNKTLSVPWTHNGVVDLLNDIKNGKLDSLLMGNTIDTNRIYGVGHSIGGSAAAQICIKHPEIFAAFHSHSGWSRYWGVTNSFFNDQRGCLVFSGMIGGNNNGKNCDIDNSVAIQGNADQKYLPLDKRVFPAWKYTDLNWYFGKTGDVWNYRDPSFPSPFVFVTTGSQDDPENQGDNLIPALEMSRRGYMYYRVDGGHTAGGFFVRWDWLRKFKKNQSFCAFTNRNYDEFGDFKGETYTGTGKMNDLEVHGWDPETIVDSSDFYRVRLTGTGTADVTLHRLQNLEHRPGTVYQLAIDRSPKNSVTADVFGLVTIPAVKGAATIELRIVKNRVEQKALK